MASKRNTGALWINKYKRSAADPDLQGEININGQVVRIVAWHNESPAINIRVNYKDLKKKQEVSCAPSASDKPHPVDTPPEEFDDDIPF